MEIKLADYRGGRQVMLELDDVSGLRFLVALTRTDADILRQLLTEWLEETEGPAAGRGGDDADGRESCHDQPC